MGWKIATIFTLLLETTTKWRKPHGASLYMGLGDVQISLIGRYRGDFSDLVDPGVLRCAIATRPTMKLSVEPERRAAA